MSVAIESTLPGVTALVNTAQVSRPFQRQPTSTAFVVGFANWGPIRTPKTVTSWEDFRRTYGKFNQYGYLAEFAYIFFNHYGGKQIVVVRAADEGALEYSTVIRNNRASTPVANFEFRAKYPSETVDVTITVTDTANTDKVDLKFVSVELGITETYLDIDLRIPGDRAKVNNVSNLIQVLISGNTSSGPTGRPAVGTFAINKDGTDGVSGMQASDLADYLTSFNNENLGTGQVLMPGVTDATVQAALVAHAEQYQRLAVLDFALGTSPTSASGNTIVSGHACKYYPWVETKNLSGTGNKFYPASIFAVGEMAKVDRTIGTHKAPANNGTVPGAIDVERNSDGTSVINDGVRELLNRKNINVIAPINGQGIKVYGARVLAPAGDTRIQFVHERRILNLIYYTAKIGYQWAVFATVDGQGRLFRDLKSSGQTFLRSLWQSGALYGRTEAEAFVVIADESNNPAIELQAGRVQVQLGVKLSPTAEQIFVNIDSVPLTQDLNILGGGN